MVIISDFPRKVTTSQRKYFYSSAFFLYFPQTGRIDPLFRRLIYTFVNYMFAINY